MPFPSLIEYLQEKASTLTHNDAGSIKLSVVGIDAS
jgi:hypothetical protein